MLYRKTNENIALLTELKSFCLALILVSCLFYVGLSSLDFDHSVYSCIKVEQIDDRDEFIPQIEICRDDIVFDNTVKAEQISPTIKAHKPLIRLSKSISRLTQKVKSKAPVTANKPPTGLSSSFKKPVKSVKKIKTPVTTIKKEAVLGVSKPYVLNKSLSTYPSGYQTAIPSKFFCNNIIVNAAQLQYERVDIHDHIPTDQTKSRVASNEIESKSLKTGVFIQELNF